MEKTASCRKRIWCQLNNVYKSLIKHLSSPKEIRDTLIKRYTAPNKARLQLILKQLFEVTNQKDKKVAEKVDTLRTLAAQITAQKKKLKIQEEVLTLFLCMSMSDSYETTLEIINSSAEEITIDNI